MTKFNEVSYLQYRDFVSKKTNDLGNLADNNMHMLLGMQTELGELMDIFKKNLAYGKPIDWANVKEECGDIAFYLAGFLNANGLDHNEILQRNIDKLNIRYSDVFTAEEALKRDVTKEREALE